MNIENVIQSFNRHLNNYGCEAPQELIEALASTLEECPEVEFIEALGDALTATAEDIRYEIEEG